ncbi:hypothetical protein PLANPX_2774 [Lacipirellula parvula]|uniref:Uncharacterized protein n=1 Tax=Lacipirellula parvula TaxID=2650471 RepID=A0A5K7XB41_9BACT|nr:hypothetical protein PLANPX_2774 [Lacipirellula parvula]
MRGLAGLPAPFGTAGDLTAKDAKVRQENTEALNHGGTTNTT